MPTERVIEIPWVLWQLPQAGLILDVGSCDAEYLGAIQQSDRTLHCLDPRPCNQPIPRGATYFESDLIGNTLPAGGYDCVVMLSVLEHVGLPCYGNRAFDGGDRLAVGEVRRLLKPQGLALITVPAGRPSVTSWYRQYSPDLLHALLAGWTYSIEYWGYVSERYVSIPEARVTEFSYRDMPYKNGAGAGALACIRAVAPSEPTLSTRSVP